MWGEQKVQDGEQDKKRLDRWAGARPWRASEAKQRNADNIPQAMVGHDGFEQGAGMVVLHLRKITVGLLGRMVLR